MCGICNNPQMDNLDNWLQKFIPICVELAIGKSSKNSEFIVYRGKLIFYWNGWDETEAMGGFWKVSFMLGFTLLHKILVGTQFVARGGSILWGGIL